MSTNPYAAPTTPPSLQPDEPGIRSKNHWHWFLAFGSSGFFLGVVSRLTRDSISGGIHYEALAEFAIKLLLGLGLTAICAQPRTQSKYLRYSVVTLALWVGSTFGWTLVNGRMWIDHVLINAVGLLIALVTGYLALWMVKGVRANR